MDNLTMLMNTNKSLMSLFGRLISAIRLFRYYTLRKELKRNKELLESKRSDRCFICGLGPSFRNVSFSELKGDTIVVNHFYKIDPVKEFKPTYYCMVDEAFASAEKQEVLFSAVNAYPETKYILNIKEFRYYKSRFPQNKNIYYLCGWREYPNKNSKLDITRNSPLLINSVCYAIELALYLGYKEIILLGCDFNSFALQKEIHCYQEKNDDMLRSLAAELFEYSFVADIHYTLDKYAQKHGVKIINATPGSLIDAYERDESYPIYG